MGNNEVGAALQSNSPNGYGGTVTIMVGLKKDGSIYNYRVLSHAETPGLGSKMEQWFRQEKGDPNIIGKNPATTKISVKKERRRHRCDHSSDHKLQSFFKCCTKSL